MSWKAKLAAVAFGAALLAGITAQAASASTGPTLAGTNASAGHLCNLNSSGGVYGCAMTHGSLSAVTLVKLSTSNLTNFSYNISTEQYEQAGTNLCLEFNASSTTYPVRMDTCRAIASQEWVDSGYQIVNSYASSYYGEDYCLEGSEESGFGIPLTMSPCADEYNGENW
jgi:hypothetical protein